MNHKVQDLLKRVVVKPNEIFTSRYPEHWGCHTKIKLLNGDEHEIEIRDALGSIYNPISKQEINSKILPLLRVGYEAPSIIADKIFNLEKF